MAGPEGWGPNGQTTDHLKRRDFTAARAGARRASEKLAGGREMQSVLAL
jgi:hypothetical protein